jgi:type IV fimbrial biogenesis protein FimT
MKPGKSRTVLQRWHARRGVTAVELLMVLAIVAVLSTIAAPSMVSMTNSMRQKSALNQIANDLNFARGEAIKRNARVLMCARSSANATATNDTTCATSSQNWASGWLVCVDTTNDSVDNCDATTAANPNPMVVRTALNSNLTLSASNGAVVNAIRFNANSSQGTAGAAAVVMTLGGSWSGAVSKTATVAVTGNVTTY